MRQACHWGSKVSNFLKQNVRYKIYVQVTALKNKWNYGLNIAFEKFSLMDTRIYMMTHFSDSACRAAITDSAEEMLPK